MSYTYDQRKRPQGADKAEPETNRTAAPGPSMETLMSGRAAPSAAQKGQPFDLDAAMKAKMENAFGDLSAVRFYKSQAVSDAGAEAIAQGNEIAFAPGMADFSTRAGQERLGHELSHVMSQRSGRVRGSGFLNNASLEARADREGAMAAAGQQVYVGPVTHALSDAAPSAFAAGAMQAKRNWFGGSKKKAKPAPKPKKAKKTANPVPQFIQETSTAVDPDWENLSQASKSGNAEDIKSAYDVIAEKQSQNVTEEQFDAVNDYIADSGPINGYLRGNIKMDKEAKNVQKKKINLIDQAMSKNRLGGNVKTYRGVSDVALASILMQSGDKKLKKVVSKDGRRIDHKEFAKVMNRLKGVEYTDTGFGSTSVKEQFAEGWRKGIIKREAATQVLNEKWKRHQNDPEVQQMIKEVTTDKGVNSFHELDNTDQLFIKKNIPLTTEEDDEFDEMEEQLREGMGSHLYEINAPKGAKATMIDRMRKDELGKKGNAGQQEMLVGRNARYKIKDILPIMDKGVVQKNQYRIIMDLLNDEEMK